MSGIPAAVNDNTSRAAMHAHGVIKFKKCSDGAFFMPDPE